MTKSGDPAQLKTVFPTAEGVLWRDEMAIAISKLEWEKELKALTASFVSRLKKRIQNLEKEVNEKNWAEVSKQAHQIAGAAASYGFDSVADEARAIETSALSDPSFDFTFHLQKIQTAMERYWG